MDKFVQKNYIWLGIVAVLLMTLIIKGSGNTNPQVTETMGNNIVPAEQTNNKSITTQQPSFNPDLVVAKQKCQDAFIKYNADNGGTGIRAHFNASLNTCLVDDLYNGPNAQTDTVVDIYDSYRKLIELDIFTKPEITIPVGEYLYVNGVKFATSEPAKEYDRRRYKLLELPLPDNLK